MGFIQGRVWEVTSHCSVVPANRVDVGDRREGGQVQSSVLQGDQKVSVHLMILIQEVTSNVQTVPRQSPDIY
jgi:hypothetical protein